MEGKRMPRVHRRNLLLLVALMLAGTCGPALLAQEGPMAAAPLPGPTMPGSVAEGGPTPAPVVAPDGPAIGSSNAPTALTPGGCTCGNRRGLSRWRWHRTHCK